MIPLPPPPPHEMRAGTRLVAGFGMSTVLPDIDFETFSEADLKDVGMAAYAMHPSTEVLCGWFDLKDGIGPEFWKPGMPNPQRLFDHFLSGGLLESFNIGFERMIWLYVCTRLYGWPDIRPWMRQLRCAAAKSRAHGLPGALGIAADVVGTAVRKDKAGKYLLNLFSKPRKPTLKDPRKRIYPGENDVLDKTRALYDYCLDDIKAEAGVSAACPDLEGAELEFWLSDQAINLRGVHIDRQGVRNCIAVIEQAHERYNAELPGLTGGAVERASQLQRLKEWLALGGVVLEKMDEDHITEALERDDLPPACRRALEIRSFIGSASVKKVFAMDEQAGDDDRLRELFIYHNARTGRPTGAGPQPTNLPKAGPVVYRCGCGRHASDPKFCRWCGVVRPPADPDRKIGKVEWNVSAAEDALEIISSRSYSAVEFYFGDAMLAVSGCLRSLFNAAPGKDLISSDFTAIEAVVLAALSGEQWRLDVFEKGTDIYLESISRSSGVPMEILKAFPKANGGQKHPLRQGGKVTELSLGFGGWINALKAMYKQQKIKLTKTDEELKKDIVAWRNASPAVVEFWGGQSRNFGRVQELFGLEGAAISAVLSPNTEFRANRLDGTFTGVSYERRADVLYCKLPSGRRIAYHRPRLDPAPAGKAWRGRGLSFEGYNTNPKQGATGWVRMPTYGAKLTENVVQAVARDIQREAINNLEAFGYPVVLHVYDEDVCEVPEGFGSVEEMERIMCTLPAWAQRNGKPWPIKAAGGWRHKRYQKA